MGSKTAMTFVWLSSLYCFTLVMGLSSPWSPAWLPQDRDDLRCDSSCDHCKDVRQECDYDGCCTCEASTAVEGYEHNFLFEYTSASGKSIALPKGSFDSSMVYKIEFDNNDMTEIPSNICDWDMDPLVTELTESAGLNGLGAFWNNTVLIDLRYNKIRHIPDMNCLAQLDRLDLSHNQITHVSNTSFAELRYLRKVDLSYNRIQTIDARVFTDNFNPFKFDVSNNQLQHLDVTNVLRDKQWCKFDYSENSLSSVTNVLNFRLEPGKTYGPGITSLAFNLFKTIPDLKRVLGISSLAEMGRLLSCGFDVEGFNIACDCNIFEFVDLAIDVLEDLYRDYMNITCSSPDDVKGMFVMNVAHDKLRCSDIKYCPVGCTCLDQPSSNTLFVNCSGTGLEELPGSMPESSSSKFINLDVSHNSISKFSSSSYLEDISFLNISNNRLVHIDDEVVNYIGNSSYIDISNNGHPLNLPRRMQVLNPCVLNMTNLNILCNCDTLWISDWLEEQCTNVRDFDGNFKCILPDGVLLDARKFTKETLKCIEAPESYIIVNVTLAVIACLFIGVALLAYAFRYEIYIMYLRLRRPFRNNNILPVFKYDVFISLDEDNDSVLNWARFLLPNLEELGYTVFLPYRHLPAGPRETIVSETLRDCRAFIVILSDSYLDQDQEGVCWTENEWKYGWRMFKGNSFKKLILINFDHISSFDVTHRQIKAFLRVGPTIDFGNRKGDIIQQIEVRLGPPNNTLMNEFGLKNKRKVFPKSALSASSKHIDSPDIVKSVL